jgi:hypothetical protein
MRASACICALVLLSVLGGGAPTLRAAAAGPLTTTVYLPNVTKMLGGADGWQTPFIVQNVGTAPTDLTIDFFAFSDGSLVKSRTVTGLAPGTSVFHDPNSDTGLAPGGQYSVVVRSYGAPVVSVVNEHQNVTNTARQEALSYLGLSSGSTRVFAPYAAKTFNGWLTTFIMQNLGPIPSNVSAQFKSLDGTFNGTITRTIAPGRSAFIDPTVESTLPAATEFAVSFTSDQPMGLVVNAHNDAAGVAAPKGFSYNGVAAPSATTSVFPYARKNVNGMSTRLLIQNAGVAPAAPTVRFRLAAQFANPIVVQGPSLAPGASWSYDPGTNAAIADGEYGVTVAGGLWAVVGAALGATVASGSTGTDARATTLFFPNVTRTLGGPSGWTTPLAIQSTNADSVTLKWYRFADGALVYRQVLIFNEFGQTFRIDPRQIPDLTDDTQYAVVATSSFGGIAGMVTGMNFSGGDGAMDYEGVQTPPSTPFGTSACAPASAPSGTTFNCVFYGFMPGASVTSASVSTPSGQPVVFTPASLVGADGVLRLFFGATTQGPRTMTITVGGQTQTASFTVTSPSFGITFVESKFGSVTINTLPAIACSLEVILPNGQRLNDPSGLSTRITTAQGITQWIYTKPAGTTGNGTHIVTCTSGAESPSAAAGFTAP